MNFSIRYIAILVISTFLLLACQQEEKQEAKKVEKTEKVASVKVDVVEPESIEAKTEETTTEHKNGSNDGHGHPHLDIPPVVTGEKYRVVEPQMKCEKPVVIEFYAYHCPHCYNLEPEAEAWRKKNADKVEFITVPTHLGHERLGVLLLAHHAAKKLNILEKTQHALFKRFHEEKKLFGSQDELAQFLADQGADLEKAKQVLADQASIGKAIEADFEILNKYKITSVPQVLVNHRYMTDSKIAGGHENVFKVVDEVLQLESSCGN